MSPLEESRTVDIVGLTLRTRKVRPRPSVGTIELWLTNGSGLPVTRVRTGTITIGTTFASYTGKFTSPYTLPANTSYAVAFWLPSNIAIPRCLTIGATTQGYYWRRVNSTKWNGPFTPIQWIFRVECVSRAGRFMPYGRACRGTAGTPAIGNVGLPALGKSFQITLSSARKLAMAPLLLGESNTRWHAFKLPLDLRVIGAPSCFVNASPDIVLGGITGNRGQRATTVPIPGSVRLLGRTFFAQYAVFDRGANTFGLVTTAGGAATVGL